MDRPRLPLPLAADAFAFLDLAALLQHDMGDPHAICGKFQQHGAFKKAAPDAGLFQALALHCIQDSRR